MFRRTEVDLYKPGNILDRARSWFTGTAASWDSAMKAFRFPTTPGQPDATIHFGNITSKQEAIDRYQGTEFQFIGVDELGQWTEDVYTYLFSRLRRLKGLPVPVRMRGAGNPGGRGAIWVRRRFVEYARHQATGTLVKEFLAMRNRDEPLPEPHYFESPPSTEAIATAREWGRRAQGAYFVPAFLEDNPGLDRAEYSMALSKLDPETRKQLKDGDWWAIASGMFFQEGWFNYGDVLPPEVRTRIRYWDLAATRPRKGRDPDWTAGVRVGIERLKTGGHKIWIDHVRRFREDPGTTELEVKGIAELDGKRVAQWFEEEPGSSGKNNTHNYAARVLFGWTVEGMRKTGAKEEYWKPLSSVARNGMLWLVRGPWNQEFVEELCALTNDDSHGHDDMADAAGGALSILTGVGSAADRARILSRST